jgi:hypothetical protein
MPVVGLQLDDSRMFHGQVGRRGGRKKQRHRREDRPWSANIHLKNSSSVA